MADGAVTAVEIADGEVNAAELAAGAVTRAKLADAAINSAKIADGEVGAAEIADAAVSSSEIADASVAQSDLDPDSVADVRSAGGTVAADNTFHTVLTIQSAGTLQVQCDGGNNLQVQYGVTNADTTTNFGHDPFDLAPATMATIPGTGPSTRAAPTRSG